MVSPYNIPNDSESAKTQCIIPAATFNPGKAMSFMDMTSPPSWLVWTRGLVELLQHTLTRGIDSKISKLRVTIQEQTRTKRAIGISLRPHVLSKSSSTNAFLTRLDLGSLQARFFHKTWSLESIAIHRYINTCST